MPRNADAKQVRTSFVRVYSLVTLQCGPAPKRYTGVTRHQLARYAMSWRLRGIPVSVCARPRADARRRPRSRHCGLAAQRRLCFNRLFPRSNPSDCHWTPRYMLQGTSSEPSGLAAQATHHRLDLLRRDCAPLRGRSAHPRPAHPRLQPNRSPINAHRALKPRPCDCPCPQRRCAPLLRSADVQTCVCA